MAAQGMAISQANQLLDQSIRIPKYRGKITYAKLIDRLGNLDDAVQWAGELAKIKGALKPVYPKEDKITFLRKLVDTLFKDINISGTVTDNFRYIIN